MKDNLAISKNGSSSLQNNSNLNSQFINHLGQQDSDQKGPQKEKKPDSKED